MQRSEEPVGGAATVQDEAIRKDQLISLTPPPVSPAGLVPEQEVQRAADEAAERSGGPAARLLPGPEEDAASRGQAGGPRHSGTGGLRVLRR